MLEKVNIINIIQILFNIEKKLENNKKLYRFICPIKNCPKSFQFKNNLVTHIRTHYKIRPFICTYCSKTFNEKGNLKTHLRIHTGERPYQCLECKKNFKALGQLKDHILSHTYYKPFKCAYCLKNFRRKGILKHHMRIHLKDPNYLYNKTYYDKYFHDLKLESKPIKNLMKLYSIKTDSKKKLCLKKIKPKKKTNYGINVSDGENKNLEVKNVQIEMKEEKGNNNLFKIENKNFKINNNQKSKIIINDNIFNKDLNQINNSQLNNCNLGELFDNNVINNNLININNQGIDLLNIINNRSFNISNNFDYSVNNYLSNNYIPFNTNNIFNFNNNNLFFNNLFNNNLFNYYNSNLTQVNPNQINSNNFNPNLFNIQTNALINANYLLKAKIDLLNTIRMNLGTNLSNINPNLNIESSNENKK